MMMRAVALARRGEGRVEPNPMVGCVIARGGRILGEGYHRRFGGPHAEVEALRSCRSGVSGATAYVTLEPCCHFGKTPPCVAALTDARLARVVVAVLDPNPLVSGKGIAQLRSSGLHVDVGMQEPEVLEVLAPYLTRTLLGRPYVIAKWAQSLDGKLATPTGDSKWISGAESRRLVHKLRARVDAVLVGVKTVLCDDPLLTARDVPMRRVAQRVVLDTKLRIPLSSKLVRSAGEVPVVVLTDRARAASPKMRRLADAGVMVKGCGVRRGRIELKSALRVLHREGVTNLLVEGGPTVLSSFFDKGLVDEAWVFTAPVILGSSKAPGPFDEGRISRVAKAIRPKRIHTRRVGEDSFHRLWLTDPPVAR